MPKVIIADKMSPQAAEVLRERGIEVEIATGLAPEALIARIGACDGLAVRSATQVTEAAIAAAGQLKVIGRAGIGVDNIDVEAAQPESLGSGRG